MFIDFAFFCLFLGQVFMGFSVLNLFKKAKFGFAECFYFYFLFNLLFYSFHFLGALIIYSNTLQKFSSKF